VRLSPYAEAKASANESFLATVRFAYSTISSVQRINAEHCIMTWTEFAEREGSVEGEM